MTLPANGYIQQVEVVVGGNLPRAGFVQPVENAGGGGGIVTGSGAAGQVTFWTGTQTVSGSSSFLWDEANKKFTVYGAVGTAQRRLGYNTSNYIDEQATSAGNMTWTVSGTRFNINVLSGAAVGQCVIQLTGAGSNDQYVGLDLYDQTGRIGSFIYGGDHVAGEKSVGFYNRLADYAVVACSFDKPIWFITDAIKRWKIDGTSGDFLAFSNNLYNIGNSGGIGQPANIWFATKILAPTTATNIPSLVGEGFTTTGIGWAVGSVINFITSGTLTWQISGGGHLLCGSDNTFNIGASGANRPASVFVGGQFVAPSTGTTSPTFVGSGLTTTGMGIGAGPVINFDIGGTLVWQFNAGGNLLAGTDNLFNIGASGANRPKNIFVSGFLSSGVQCLTKTASTYAIPASEQRAEYDNAGAGAQVAFTLPVSVVGMAYTFVVLAAQNLRISGNGSDTIRVGASVSTATTGHIDNATVGGVIRLTCHVAGTWIATYQQGTWTVT